MYDSAKYLPSGDRALVIEFGNSISEAVNCRVRALEQEILNNSIPGIVEMIPTYRSLMVIYDPLIIGFVELVDTLKSIEAKLNDISLTKVLVVEIPVIYGGEYGPDINFVAEYNKISVDEVINIHTSLEYLIYMIGFVPGFPYLGGMSEKIGAPRLESPRTRIPSGSVGIAGKQTGIYPIESPGGWRIIGRTPVKLYDPYREEPVILKAGDYIKFVEIDKAEYNSILEEEKTGTYKVKRSVKNRI